ncbi:hypothetical protein EV363DRAFT_1296971 [Boletus edulis]|nr:hypothetical protein EV363DRAFT_1296971 [Boletus edulis]
MLVLSEGTLFFWNVYHASSNKNSKDSLTGKVKDWMVTVKPDSQKPRISLRQSNTPPPTSISASTTTASNLKSMSIGSNPSTAERESIPEEELVGGFGNDDLDDGEECAALASSTREAGGHLN